MIEYAVQEDVGTREVCVRVSQPPTGEFPDDVTFDIILDTNTGTAGTINVSKSRIVMFFFEALILTAHSFCFVILISQVLFLFSYMLVNFVRSKNFVFKHALQLVPY